MRARALAERRRRARKLRPASSASLPPPRRPAHRAAARAASACSTRARRAPLRGALPTARPFSHTQNAGAVGLLREPYGQRLNGLALSPSGRLLALATEQGSQLQVWDVASGRPGTDSAPIAVGSAHSEGVLSVCAQAHLTGRARPPDWARCGLRTRGLATGAATRRARALPCHPRASPAAMPCRPETAAKPHRTPRLIVFRPHRPPAGPQVAWSPDEKQLVSVGKDGLVAVWNWFGS